MNLSIFHAFFPPSFDLFIHQASRRRSYSLLICISTLHPCLSHYSSAIKLQDFAVIGKRLHCCQRRLGCTVASDPRRRAHTSALAHVRTNRNSGTSNTHLPAMLLVLNPAETRPVLIAYYQIVVSDKWGETIVFAIPLGGLPPQPWMQHRSSVQPVTRHWSFMVSGLGMSPTEHA